MAKVRFTEEQIADFLQQSKNGVPNNVLCEKFGFSPSTLRRWQELHAQRIRGELKQAEKNRGLRLSGLLDFDFTARFYFLKTRCQLGLFPFSLYFTACVTSAAIARCLQNISRKEIPPSHVQA